MSQDFSKDFFCSLDLSQHTGIDHHHHLRKKSKVSTLASIPLELVNNANHAVVTLELKIYSSCATLKDLQAQIFTLDAYVAQQQHDLN